MYNLPENVLFCKKCTVSFQRLKITFIQIIDSWWTDHIYYKDNTGKWKFKDPIWK